MDFLGLPVFHIVPVPCPFSARLARLGRLPASPVLMLEPTRDLELPACRLEGAATRRTAAPTLRAAGPKRHTARRRDEGTKAILDSGGHELQVPSFWARRHAGAFRQRRVRAAGVAAPGRAARAIAWVWEGRAAWHGRRGEAGAV